MSSEFFCKGNPMTEQLTTLPITSISPNPYQPRTVFSQEELTELAQSIRENGLIQPIIVRPSAIAGYELVAGERRFRASQLAGLTHITAIVKELTDEDSMKQAIIENLQRADLNPIEEALSYHKLIDKLQFTHDELAQIMGKSRPYITNSLRLLQLSDQAKEALATKTISPGHARLLLSLPTKDQNKWLNQVIKQNLTVRQLENQLKTKPKKAPQQIDPFIAEQEKQLKQQLGLDCQIKVSPAGHGQLTISFSSLDDFHNLIHNLSQVVDS